MRYLLLRLKRFCGFITGFVFFLSGIVKLMDPVGAGLVMKEYYEFLHLSFLTFSAKPAGVLFALAETVIGTALITGVWRRITAQCAIVLQGFFTILTLLLVIFNPEMDCGCFGEAIHLTHLQTFVKNIILLALLLIYYIPRKHLGETRKKKYVSFALVTASVVAFTIYSWISIPMIDFTAYKAGSELQTKSSSYTEDIYESVFKYEKAGKVETFTLDNLPDSTWTFVSTETVRKAGTEDLSVGLSFYSISTGEYEDELAAEGSVMVVSVYDTNISDRKWEKTEAFMKRAKAAGFSVILLCSSEEGLPASLKDKAYISDFKTLVSMNRSNGGVTYFHNGMLIRKWSSRNAPDIKSLEDIRSADATEVSISHNSKGSLGFQSFLLYVFVVMLLL
ncbi:MAG: DoxX family protein [Bacteroidales bacterium]|nr:DoxX family protein [Bacteroidales bacterium]